MGWYKNHLTKDVWRTIRKEWEVQKVGLGLKGWRIVKLWKDLWSKDLDLEEAFLFTSNKDGYVIEA